ncbi:unnamed protein product [Lupinus luteus]|uniref:Protein root UVB sensitive 5 n=1 Tax=Lupinus luteus TaxID=3873 RepID=A0AAV1W4U6_LUPLU
MSQILQLSFSSTSTGLSSSVKMKGTAKRPFFFQILCSSSKHSSFKDEDDDNVNKGFDDDSFFAYFVLNIVEKDRGLSRVILVERYSNGTAKRYVVDDDSQLQTFLFEEDKSTTNMLQDSQRLSWLPEIIKDFILPAGFPGSVSDDYLNYMLLQFPTNVTGWICHTLVTSTLLTLSFIIDYYTKPSLLIVNSILLNFFNGFTCFVAVGVGSFSGSTAAASAAAIRWVSKDGIGAVGRLFIGGRFGNLFDDDPKQWRMYADFIGSAGSIFDLTTQLYPDYFLPLASLGNLTKAIARGLKDPSFRVIQNHFALSGNVGDVAAKEEVWEVVAQLAGLGLGILILDTPGLVKSYPVLLSTWMSMRLLHIWLRYESLSVLQFNTINLKRARILVKSHVLHSTVPGCKDCNREENILTWPQFMKPEIIFGLPLEKMNIERSHFMVKAFLKLYAHEKYILMVNQQQQDLRFHVSFKVGATSVSVLRSVWQSFWLSENWNREGNVCDQLGNSLMELENKFEDFIQKLKVAEWDTQKLNLKVPKEILIDDINPL